MFCKGALLRDAQHILVKPGENTQAARQVRFISYREIVQMGTVLKKLIFTKPSKLKNGSQGAL